MNFSFLYREGNSSESHAPIGNLAADWRAICEGAIFLICLFDFLNDKQMVC